MSTSTNAYVIGITKLPFWDVDFDRLDAEKDCLFILEKVFNYAPWMDYKAVFAHYGQERIRREIINAAYLKKDVLVFLCLILQLKPTDFSCYMKTQSLPVLWDY
jgi:hypothetical protein